MRLTPQTPAVYLLNFRQRQQPSNTPNTPNSRRTWIMFYLLMFLSRLNPLIQHPWVTLKGFLTVANLLLLCFIGGWQVHYRPLLLRSVHPFSLPGSHWNRPRPFLHTVDLLPGSWWVMSLTWIWRLRVDFYWLWRLDWSVNHSNWPMGISVFIREIKQQFLFF